LKYYIYVLERNGIEGVTGILEYPTMRQTEKVTLNDADRKRIVEIEKDIDSIVGNEKCPAVINSKICKQCSYYDFCYVEE